MLFQTAKRVNKEYKSARGYMGVHDEAKLMYDGPSRKLQATSDKKVNKDKSIVKKEES